MTKDQAVQSAGAKLDQLNETMNRVLLAAVASASMLTILTAIACYGAFEYIRIKSALSEASTKASQGLRDLRKEMDRKAPSRFAPPAAPRDESN